MKRKTKRTLSLVALMASSAFMGVQARASDAIEVDKLVVADNTTTSEVAASAGNDVMAAPDVPMGSAETDQPSLLPEEDEVGDVFGLKGGYFHPYLNISGAFSDNLYNSYRDEVDDFLTKVSPGVWFALPRKKVIPISIVPHNTSPGGLQNQLSDVDYTDKFMSYALLGADFKMYSEDSDLNDTDLIGEGLLRYNMNSGLSLQLVDRYTQAEDSFTYQTEDRKDERALYKSNMLIATGDWEFTEKLRAKVDFSNFDLAYDNAIDDYLSRTDNGMDLYGYYNATEKTALFLEYKLIDVSYDETESLDNTQDFMYAGIKWDTTEKLSLLLKGGYQHRDFDSDALESYDGFTMDLQTTYRYSEKTEMKFSLYRTNEETDSYMASDREVWGANFDYSQKMTEKITGLLNMTYEDADYTALSGYSDTYQRTFSVQPALQYQFKEWFQAELAYSYETVDSDDETAEYDTNSIMASLNFAL